MTPKLNPLERERRHEIQQRRRRRRQQRAEQREHHSLNFECLSTFKSKWKRFWIIILNILAKIVVTKHILLADEFIPYRGLVGLSFFKCDEMRLRWVFTDQTAVILLKNIFEFMLNRARSILVRVVLAEVLGERVLILYFQRCTQCVLRGSVVAIWPGASKVPGSTSDRTFFSSLLFCYFFFFSFSFLFSYCSFVLFLYIA